MIEVKADDNFFGQVTTHRTEKIGIIGYDT